MQTLSKQARSSANETQLAREQITLNWFALTGFQFVCCRLLKPQVGFDKEPQERA